MKIEVKRMARGKYFTQGAMYINKVYFCDTLEDPVRAVKIPKDTAIPTGEYIIRSSMSARFKKRMPEILNVPGFSGVRIHAGNSVKDTEGCILVGVKVSDGMIGKSAATRDELYKLIFNAEERGESITISIN